MELQIVTQNFANNPNSDVDIIELSQAEAQKGYAAGLFEKIRL